MGLSDLKKRKEDAARKIKTDQEKIKTELNNFLNENKKLNVFKEKHIPLFKLILIDFAKEIDMFFSENKGTPNYNEHKSYRLHAKDRDGFWNSIFPKKTQYGAIFYLVEVFKVRDWKNSNGEEVFKVNAIRFSRIGYDVPDIFVDLDEVPDDLDEAKEFFNSFLYRCYEKLK